CGAMGWLPLSWMDANRSRWAGWAWDERWGRSDDADAHRAGGAGDLLLGRLDVVGVEVGHLDLGDLFDLGVGDGGDLRSADRRRALLDLGRFLEQHRGRRGLQDERERAVLVDRDLDRDDRAPLVLGLGVVLLAEVHDRHTVRTEGGADRRR